MANNSKLVLFPLLIVLFVLLQGAFIFADSVKTPVGIAENFTKAYYKMSPCLPDYLCSELSEEEEMDMASEYISRMRDESVKWGHQPDYIRSHVTRVHTEVIDQNDDRAVVHVTGKRKRHINPAFTLVGQLFFLGNTYPFEHTLELVKEDGGWKVCNDPIQLSSLL